MGYRKENYENPNANIADIIQSEYNVKINMENYRITLQEHLDKYGWLKSGMIAKSVLIDKLEIYGFVNCSKEIKTSYSNYNFRNVLSNIVVNKSSTSQIIQSNYIYQVVNIEGQSKGIVSPIYNRLTKSENNIEVDIKQLHIPKLFYNTTYKKIRSRYKDGNQPIKLTNYEQKTLEEYLEISIKEGKLMVVIHNGDILCQNNDDTIKSIGEEILVVCRYIHDLTGNMCYTQYGLDELTIELDYDF